jgi:hypothetical protein
MFSMSPTLTPLRETIPLSLSPNNLSCVRHMSPCTHASQKRLRCRKGMNHILCLACGLKWRTPHVIIAL